MVIIVGNAPRAAVAQTIIEAIERHRVTNLGHFCILLTDNTTVSFNGTIHDAVSSVTKFLSHSETSRPISYTIFSCSDDFSAHNASILDSPTAALDFIRKLTLQQ